MGRKEARRIDVVARLGRTEEPAFVEEVVRPLVGDVGALVDCETAGGEWGRAVVRYRFASGRVVWGKLFTDDRGPHAGAVLQELWRHGFGNGDPFRIPEPLGWVEQHRLLLIGDAGGRAPADPLDPAAEGHIRAAARWLARLHRCPVRVGAPEHILDSAEIFPVLLRLAKAVEASPQQRKHFVHLVNGGLRCGKKSGPEQRPLVQTHGRAEPRHVFVNGESTTLIDLDESAPADAAKDLARFVHSLRWEACRRTGSGAAADGAVRLFLEEYGSRLPQNLENLSVHWSSLLLKTYYKLVLKIAAGKRGTETYQAGDGMYEVGTDTIEEELDAVIFRRFEPPIT